MGRGGTTFFDERLGAPFFLTYNPLWQQTFIPLPTAQAQIGYLREKSDFNSSSSSSSSSSSIVLPGTKID
jgi:hypothetical protein